MWIFLYALIMMEIYRVLHLYVFAARSWMSEWRSVHCSRMTVIYSQIGDMIYVFYLKNIAFKSENKKP